MILIYTDQLFLFFNNRQHFVHDILVYNYFILSYQTIISTFLNWIIIMYINWPKKKKSRNMAKKLELYYNSNTLYIFCSSFFKNHCKNIYIIKSTKTILRCKILTQTVSFLYSVIKNNIDCLNMRGKVI